MCGVMFIMRGANAVTAEKIKNRELATKAWSVEDVLDTFPDGRPIANDNSPVPFFHVLERLKTTKREGWRRFGIST
jgi:putative hydrolase of HD superfamily